MRTRLNSLIGALFLAQLGAVAAHAEELNRYTTREPKLVEPLLASFTEKTGITVNTIFLKDGMPERVAQEGDASPAVPWRSHAPATACSTASRACANSGKPCASPAVPCRCPPPRSASGCRSRR